MSDRSLYLSRGLTSAQASKEGRQSRNPPAGVSAEWTFPSSAQRRIVLAASDEPASSSKTEGTSAAQAAHHKRAGGGRDLTSSHCSISTVTTVLFLFTIRPRARG